MNQTCTNILGTYICDGNISNLTCPDCPICGENADCLADEITHEPYCGCNPGFEGNPLENCTDINECEDDSKNDCDIYGAPNRVCVNSQGSYTCICPNGYQMNSTSGKCEDIDECDTR